MSNTRPTVTNLNHTGEVITKLTRGGVLSLGEQEIDWTDPAMRGLSIVDLAESYAIFAHNLVKIAGLTQ